MLNMHHKKFQSTYVTAVCILQKLSIKCTQSGLLHPEFAAKNLYVWLWFYGERSYLKNKLRGPAHKILARTF